MFGRDADEGDPLETLDAADFERFRPISKKAAERLRHPKRDSPVLDVVPEFRMLALRSLAGRGSRRRRDRAGRSHFRGPESHDTVPAANALRDFCEARAKANTMDELFRESDRMIDEAKHIPRSGLIASTSQPRRAPTASQSIKAAEAGTGPDPAFRNPKSNRKSTEIRPTAHRRPAMPFQLQL